MDEKIMSYILISIVWSPLIITYVLYKIHLIITKNKWQAIHFATEWSTVFYIAATAILLKYILNQSVISYILIVLILILAFILIKQWKNHTEVILIKGIKTLLRISFLLFFVCYILVGGYQLVSIFIMN